MRPARILLPLLLIFASKSWAYLSISGSGEMPTAGSYILGFEPQILMNEGGGINVGGFLDQPLAESLSARYSLGVGKIDFHLGTGIKWIPFPDVDRQPAMGLKATAWYARQKDMNVWTMQVAPMASKKYDMDFGVLIPYAAVPINFVSSSEKNVTGTQFVIGSDLRYNNMEHMFFSAEVAINLKDSYSFISGTVSFPFDAEHGFKGRQ